MTESEATTITAAMILWADRKSDPDKPFMFFGGSSVSPRELAEAVKGRTPLGIKQLEVFDLAMKSGAETFKTILTGLGWRDDSGGVEPSQSFFPPKGPAPGVTKGPDWSEHGRFYR
jgi:hypothetical protein